MPIDTMPNITLDPEEAQQHTDTERRRKILETSKGEAARQEAINAFHAAEQKIGEATLDPDQVKVQLDLSDEEFETLVRERKLQPFKKKDGEVVFLQSSVDYMKTLKEIQEGEETKKAA